MREPHVGPRGFRVGDNLVELALAGLDALMRLRVAAAAVLAAVSGLGPRGAGGGDRDRDHDEQRACHRYPPGTGAQNRAR